jgi:hypothetical protein
MSAPRYPQDVKLVASILSGDVVVIGAVVQALAGRYGVADYIGAPVAFSFTGYYKKELGVGLIRRFVAFERLIRPESLPEVKLWTNELEKEFSAGEKRRVNIDPGYLAPAHLILATGKGYSHRPCLREGIYADLTLTYQKGGFQILPWTYPDYAEGEMIGILTRIREKYLLQLKGEKHGE